jgi:hypothetical protein
MVDKKRKNRYNEIVKVIFEDGKTIFKLYREGKLIYIGVTNEPTQQLGIRSDV